MCCGPGCFNKVSPSLLHTRVCENSALEVSPLCTLVTTPRTSPNYTIGYELGALAREFPRHPLSTRRGPTVSESHPTHHTSKSEMMPEQSQWGLPETQTLLGGHVQNSRDKGRGAPMLLGLHTLYQALGNLRSCSGHGGVYTGFRPPPGVS